MHKVKVLTGNSFICKRILLVDFGIFKIRKFWKNPQNPKIPNPPSLLAEMITGQGNPALPCTLSCPVAGTGCISVFYPTLLHGRTGYRAGHRVKIFTLRISPFNVHRKNTFFFMFFNEISILDDRKCFQLAKRTVLYKCFLNKVWRKRKHEKKKKK